MNFLTLGAKSLRKAQKAVIKYQTQIETAKSHGLDTSDMAKPEEIFEQTLEDDFKFIEQAMDIGLKYFAMAKKKLKNPEDEARYYMLTIRPPPTVKWETFKYDCDVFLKKWSDKWEWAEWAYEQKGTDQESMGTGFHIHLVLKTTVENYYPSHIRRDAEKQYTYVAKNCIDCAKVASLTRAREYIRGIKNDSEKEEAVKWDSIWRESKKLESLYESGQVQPALN